MAWLLFGSRMSAGFVRGDWATKKLKRSHPEYTHTHTMYFYVCFTITVVYTGECAQFPSLHSHYRRQTDTLRNIQFCQKS